MVPVSHHGKEVLVRLKKFRSHIDDLVQVSAAAILLPHGVLGFALVPLALHNAMQVANINDWRVVLQCPVQMLLVKVAVAMRVVEVNVRHKKNGLSPARLAPVEIDGDHIIDSLNVPCGLWRCFIGQRITVTDLVLRFPLVLP